jgi:hypothetical protein
MVPRLLYTACPSEVTDIIDIDDWPLPEPCCRCGRPASPFVETLAGPLCVACAGGPDAPDGALAWWRDVVLSRTHRRLVAARLARELAPVIAPACRGNG